MVKRIKHYKHGEQPRGSLNYVGICVAKSNIKKQLFRVIYYHITKIIGYIPFPNLRLKHFQAAGKTEQPLHFLDAWHIIHFYTDKECDAEAWTHAYPTGGWASAP